MAEAHRLSLTSFKKHFDDQLTCGVCLDRYTNPKMLPCGHTFCLLCIQQLPAQKKEGKYYISCPKCRVDHLTPEGGAINLPTAFEINNFLDLHKKLDIPKTETNKETQETTTCPKHNDPLKVYCETCCQIICRDCTISTEHNTHNFYLISECYTRHYQQLLDSLDLVKYKAVDIEKAATRLATKEEKVLQKRQQLKEKISTHSQQIIDRIQKSCTRLLQQVDTIVQQKMQVLTAQRQQAQKLHTQLKICQDAVEHSLKEWTKQQILTQKQTMLYEMTETTQLVDPAIFVPIENAEIKFAENDFIIEEIGLITGTTYGNATLKVSPVYLAKQPRPSIVTLTLHSHNGSPFSLPPSLISSTLCSPGDKYIVKCDISQTHPGEYNITLTPSTRGAHILTVQVGGVNIPDSPLILPVIPTPEMRGKPVNIITGLDRPCGVAVCDNKDILVAESNAHCITMLNKMGKKLMRSFGIKGRLQLMNPCGVAISNDRHILVTSKHRLQKLTIDGVCVKSVGSSEKGSGPLEFNYPNGIAVHPTTGQIFVADICNYRIQVFNRDLTFSHTITHKQLIAPCDVALDNEGYLYTADFGNHCITKFTATGQYIKHIASLQDTKQLLHITINNNLVYVSENKNDRVSIFDATGKLLHSFGKTGSGEGEFNGLMAMTTDTLCNLYVCDISNNRIVVYIEYVHMNCYTSQLFCLYVIVFNFAKVIDKLLLHGYVLRSAA